MNYATLEDCLRLSQAAIARLKDADFHAMSMDEIRKKLYDAFDEAYEIQLHWLYECKKRDKKRRYRKCVHALIAFGCGALTFFILAKAFF